MKGLTGLDGHDAYALLGVGEDATDEEIIAAHRRLVRLSHPDRRPGDPEAAARETIRLNVARDILLRDRTAYDAHRRPRPADSPAGRASDARTADPRAPDPRAHDPWDDDAPEEVPDDPWDGAAAAEPDPWDDATPTPDPDPWDDARPGAAPPPPRGFTYEQPAYEPYERPAYRPYEQPVHGYGRAEPWGRRIEPRPRHPISRGAKILIGGGLGCLGLFLVLGVLGVVATFVSNGEPEALTVPSVFVGDWKGSGKLKQNGEELKLSVTVTRTAGSTEYKCGGELVLVEATAKSVTFHELVTAKNCDGDAYVRLSTRTDRRLDMVFCRQMSCSAPHWRGTLTRK